MRRVAGLLSHLHDNGCARDKAGNRELHFDDYVLLILLYLFNPMIDSMRSLQQIAEFPEVQKRLGIKRFSLGSFSESCRVFDPAMLQGVVKQLAGELRPVDRHELFKQLPGKLTLVDSTVIDTLCTDFGELSRAVVEAMFLPLGDGKHSHAWRLHLQFDVDHHVPGEWEITPPKNTGKSDEKSVLRRRLKPGHTYVMASAVSSAERTGGMRSSRCGTTSKRRGRVTSAACGTTACTTSSKIERWTSVRSTTA